MKSDYKGVFIVLEGLDGAGTTTQVHRLAKRIRTMGFRVHITREPTEGPVARWIRLALRKRVAFAPHALALLFLADRMDHLYAPNGLDTLLSDPWTVVLSDRYYLSSFAYQRVSHPKISHEWLYAIHRYALRPTLTLFLDVAPSECMQRVAATRGFHYELFESKLANLERVRASYLEAVEFLKERGDDIETILATEVSPLGVERRLWYFIKPLLSPNPRRKPEEVKASHPIGREALALLEKFGVSLTEAFLKKHNNRPRHIHLAGYGPEQNKKIVIDIYFQHDFPSTVVFGGDLPHDCSEELCQKFRALLDKYRPQKPLPLDI